jgi:hypothetical protein
VLAAPTTFMGLTITCPETGQPERIDYQVHPLGILIDACSRFCAVGRLECPRSCAAKLDRESRLDVTRCEIRRRVDDDADDVITSAMRPRDDVSIGEIIEVRSLLRRTC